MPSISHADLWKAVWLSALVAALLGAIRHFDSLPQGLRAEYFTNATWSPPAAMTGIDRRPSTVRFLDAWSGAPPEAFSAVWSGSLVAPRPGHYTLATDSDDGSLVYLDGRLVVDNGGRHPRRLVSESIDLARGPHALYVLYFQDRGELHFDLRWARDGAPLESVPAWALWARRTGSLARVMVSLVLNVAFEAARLAAIALFIAAGFVATCRKIIGTLQRAGLWRQRDGFLGR